MASNTLFAVETNGKSVFDIGVEPGSKAIINPGKKVKSGDMALVELFGTHVVCFVDFKPNGSVRLRSLDKKRQGLIADKKDPFRILGKVIKIDTGMEPKRAF
jgi:SOS-response transcriptional repressor LexA